MLAVVSDIGRYLSDNPFLRWKELRFSLIVSNIIKLSLIAAGVLLTFFLILGGIHLITAGGDKEKVAKAKGTITTAIIGIVIVFSVWAIIALIQNFFGITILYRANTPFDGNYPPSGVDCTRISITCPSGWTPSGLPYCEHPGSNTCKLKCCYGGNCQLTGTQAPWWMDSGIKCWP